MTHKSSNHPSTNQKPKTRTIQRLRKIRKRPKNNPKVYQTGINMTKTIPKTKSILDPNEKTFLPHKMTPKLLHHKFIRNTQIPKTKHSTRSVPNKGCTLPKNTYNRHKKSQGQTHRPHKWTIPRENTNVKQRINRQGGKKKATTKNQIASAQRQSKTEKLNKTRREQPKTKLVKIT